MDTEKAMENLKVGMKKEGVAMEEALANLRTNLGGAMDRSEIRQLRERPYEGDEGTGWSERRDVRSYASEIDHPFHVTCPKCGTTAAILNGISYDWDSGWTGRIMIVCDFCQIDVDLWNSTTSER